MPGPKKIAKVIKRETLGLSFKGLVLEQNDSLIKQGKRSRALADEGDIKASEDDKMSEISDGYYLSRLPFKKELDDPTKESIPAHTMEDIILRMQGDGCNTDNLMIISVVEKDEITDVETADQISIEDFKRGKFKKGDLQCRWFKETGHPVTRKDWLENHPYRKHIRVDAEDYTANFDIQEGADALQAMHAHQMQAPFNADGTHNFKEYPILIHCKSGKGRSALFSAAYHALYGEMQSGKTVYGSMVSSMGLKPSSKLINTYTTVEDSIKFIKGKRKVTSVVYDKRQAAENLVTEVLKREKRPKSPSKWMSSLNLAFNEFGSAFTENFAQVNQITDNLFLGRIPMSRGYAKLSITDIENYVTEKTGEENPRILVTSVVEKSELEDGKGTRWYKWLGSPVKPEEWRDAGRGHDQQHLHMADYDHNVDLEKAADTIHAMLEWEKQGPEYVNYVHCKSGVGRSAMISSVYLALRDQDPEKTTEEKLEQVIALLKSKRPRVNVNEENGKLDAARDVLRTYQEKYMAIETKENAKRELLLSIANLKENGFEARFIARKVDKYGFDQDDLSKEALAETMDENKRILSNSLATQFGKKFNQPKKFCGTGLRIKERYDPATGKWILTIMEVFENSPAKKIGLQKGDEITSNDAADKDLRELLTKIRSNGLDENFTVTRNSVALPYQRCTTAIFENFNGKNQLFGMKHIGKTINAPKPSPIPNSATLLNGGNTPQQAQVGG